MRILLVAATALEVAPLVATLHPLDGGSAHLRRFTRAGHDVHLLTTGVGLMNTAAWCSGLLARERYDLAVNLGVCGSFRPELPPGTVVHVTSDMVADLGAEDGECFLSLEQLGLLGPDDFPYSGGHLVNAAPPAVTVLRGLPEARGVTVNRVHGHERSIRDVVARVDPDVESMEGAAFMYCCLLHAVPFAQVRAVSNVVERRNRAAWKLGDAIQALNATASDILDQL